MFGLDNSQQHLTHKNDSLSTMRQFISVKGKRKVVFKGEISKSKNHQQLRLQRNKPVSNSDPSEGLSAAVAAYHRLLRWL